MIHQLIKDFSFTYYDPIHNTIKEGTSLSWKNQWTILFFYPADFTTVCPTELEDLASYAKNLQWFDQTALYAISTDSPNAHQEWITSTDSLKTFPFPMISDRTHDISQYFQTYNTETGNARRTTIILNPHRVIVSYDTVIDEIGRWCKELIRRLAALQQNFNHKDTLCPSSREPGDKTLLNPGSTNFKTEDFFL